MTRVHALSTGMLLALNCSSISSLARVDSPGSWVSNTGRGLRRHGWRPLLRSAPVRQESEAEIWRQTSAETCRRPSDALVQTCQSQQDQSTPARSADENVREIARKNWNGNRHSTGTLGAAAAPALGRDWRAAPILTTTYTTPFGVQPLGSTSPSQFNPPCRESAGPADFPASPGLPGEPPPDESF